MSASAQAPGQARLPGPPGAAGPAAPGEHGAGTGGSSAPAGAYHRPLAVTGAIAACAVAGTAQAKKEALEKAAVRVGRTPSETAVLAREAIRRA